MNIIVHDFAGHPGQIQLSRELASRGHSVRHQYCSSLTTGQGATTPVNDDPVTFRIDDISLGSDFHRYSPLRRVFQEILYAFIAFMRIARYRPDVVLLSNLPLIALSFLAITLTVQRIPYVVWWQDIYSEAILSLARRRWPKASRGLIGLLTWTERAAVRSAAAVIPISEAFLEPLDAWGVEREKVFVLPNWGALPEITQEPRMNAWSTAHALDQYKVIMYAGTLGLKHDPSVIAELATSAPNDCRVVVVSEGQGRQWLEDNCTGIDRLLLLDFQPYEVLPQVLATADILLAVLEDDASRYSVPSKVLSYLCAGRPILAVLPESNPAAKTLLSADAGLVSPPQDHRSAIEAMRRLLSDPTLSTRFGRNARQYAEQTFDIRAIADAFESVLTLVGTNSP